MREKPQDATCLLELCNRTYSLIENISRTGGMDMILRLAGVFQFRKHSPESSLNAEYEALVLLPLSGIALVCLAEEAF